MSTPEPGAIDVEWLDVMNEAAATLARCAIPLYQNDASKRPEQMGTGFLISMAPETVFLVSAAHVLRRAKERSVYFFVEPDRTYDIRQAGEIGTAKHDSIDIGTVKVDPKILPTLRERVDKVPVLPKMLRPRSLPRSGKYYLTVGFPSTKNRTNPSNRTTTAAPIGYRSPSISDSGYAELGIDPAIHIALPFGRKGFGPQGEPVDFPKPNGMSGAPLWEIVDEADVSHSWGVVGVMVEQRPANHPKVLIATDVRFLLDGIIK